MRFNIRQVCRIDDNSCATANYTMVANALGFRDTIQDLLKVTHGTLGQSQFWLEMLKRGVKIKCISKNDYRTFPAEASKWVADFFAERSDGTENYVEVLKNPNFDFKNRAPTIEDLRQLFDSGYAVEIMGDGWLMYGDAPEAQLLHRVFITDMNKNTIYFHDPDIDGEADFPAKASDIATALSVDGAEIVGYKR